MSAASVIAVQSATPSSTDARTCPVPANSITSTTVTSASPEIGLQSVMPVHCAMMTPANQIHSAPTTAMIAARAWWGRLCSQPFFMPRSVVDLLLLARRPLEPGLPRRVAREPERLPVDLDGLDRRVDLDLAVGLGDGAERVDRADRHQVGGEEEHRDAADADEHDRREAHLVAAALAERPARAAARDGLERREDRRAAPRRRPSSRRPAACRCPAACRSPSAPSWRGCPGSTSAGSQPRLYVTGLTTQ
jgi:hypothetical protein